MPPETFSTASLDYLQRIGFTPVALSANSTQTSAPPALRRLVRISGIGRMEKAPLPATGQPYSSGNGQPVRLLSEDLLSGLYGYKIRVAFFVLSKPDGVAVHLGIWSPLNKENASATTLNERQTILNRVLMSLHPSVDLVPANGELSAWPLSGFALGIPTAKPPDPLDSALPLDRLIRSLSGEPWAFLVLAEPVGELVISSLRHSVINETRSIQAAYPTTGAPSPLAQHYTELLKIALTTLTQGQALGAWRTGVYLLGDTTSYYRLASLWRGIFSGDQSLLDPVRVWDSRDTNIDAGGLATNWALPEMEGPPPPVQGFYRHPFQYQTLLTSSQLAAYIHLPQLETSGFTVKVVPDFDVVPQAVKERPTFSLGKVIQRTATTQTDYQVSAKAFTRHTFVAGVTGAGKTNTIFHLLKQAAGLGIPFLVIEPAKTEYRALLNDPNLAGRLRIFTLGNEMISPFRLNPFEVLPGTPVSVHLDLLRSAFSASFGMWTPLPQIIEQCLYRVYQDRGWDITSNSNTRLDGASEVADAFPTLTDLVAKVDQVIDLLEYEERISGDLRAALHTRLNGLRVGGKGRMLDVQRSLPMKWLLEYPTVLELEGMGDDDDRAFLMGLLLIRLVEYRRAQGQVDALQHVLVIEEAHRLLANVGPRRGEEEADPRGKAVEAFANLLSEIRAYGQSVLVADQVPVKLAPDVIKNTNLKIVHRIVAEDDRKVLAGTMVMNERQSNALATLTVGQAVAFSEGDDASILVQIPLAKNQAGQTTPTNPQVAAHMTALDVSQATRSLFLSFPTCRDTCSSQGNACQTARDLVEDEVFQRTFARVILSTTEETNALDRMWGEVLLVIQAKRPPMSSWKDLLRCVLIRASHWYAERRGAQAGWTYTQTRTFAEKVCQIVLDKVTQVDPGSGRIAFQQEATTLHARLYNPFPICGDVCQQKPPVCLYRHAVSDLVARGSLREGWQRAYSTDRDHQNKRMTETWETCQDAAYELIEYPEGQTSDAQRRVGLCFAQQMLVNDPERTPRTVKIMLERLLKEAHQ